MGVGHHKVGWIGHLEQRELDELREDGEPQQTFYLIFHDGMIFITVDDPLIYLAYEGLVERNAFSSLILTGLHNFDKLLPVP